MTTSTATYNRIYARIDIDNLRANVKTMQSLVKPDMKTLLVIKADAYGHGSVEIAKRTLEKGIEEVVFNRGGYIYQGKIKALADAAREEGLKF